MSIDDVRLGDYTKEEWRDVMLRLNPELTDEEYEAAWDEYAHIKRSKNAH